MADVAVDNSMLPAEATDSPIWKHLQRRGRVDINDSYSNGVAPLNIYYEIYGSGTERIVFVNGMRADHQMWESNIEQFLKLGNYESVSVLPFCFTARVDVHWEVVSFMLNRDGNTTRTTYGVNGKSPIPPVYINSGDTLALHVQNSLNEPTGIHFHGMFQENTPYYDGSDMVTQCGIPPGANFTYYITPQQEGTYWIHSHYHHQNSDGLRTPFIIRDSSPIAEYDDDILFSLEDWYPVEFSERVNDILRPGVPFPPSPEYPYGLINGYNGNDTTPIQFSPGKKYRIRVVNMGTTEWFKFSLPGHKMQIIEVEGERTVPYNASGVDVGPGQRYSMLVEAKDTDDFNYIYNATLYADFIAGAPGQNPRYYFGSVEYKKGAPVKVPAVTDDSDIDGTKDINLSPYDGEPLLEPVTKNLLFNFTTKILSDNITHAMLGNHPYSQVSVPTIYTALTMGSLATNPDVYGAQTQAQVLDYNDIVEIELRATAPLDHTFHLHGHKFQIVEYGPSPDAPASKTKNISVRRAKGSPIKRDTLTIRGWEYIKVRFRANNPGVWMFHCHMDVHFYMGLAVTFVEAPLELQKKITVPDALNQLCYSQGIKTYGNGAGNDGLNMTGLPFMPT
ncbi:ferroxidase fet3 [Coemansia sp. RSA 986]|nr:ferroxidase fet3 [Coemansia sp. RSA 986]